MPPVPPRRAPRIRPRLGGTLVIVNITIILLLLLLVNITVILLLLLLPVIVNITIILLLLLLLLVIIIILMNTWRIGGTQTGSYQTGSYQKGRFIPPKPKSSYLSFFDTTPFICLWAPWRRGRPLHPGRPPPYGIHHIIVIVFIIVIIIISSSSSITTTTTNNNNNNNIDCNFTKYNFRSTLDVLKHILPEGWDSSFHYRNSMCYLNKKQQL